MFSELKAVSRWVKNNPMLTLTLVYLLVFEYALVWATYAAFNQSEVVMCFVMPILTTPVMALLLLGILNIILPEKKYRQVITFLGWIIQLFKKNSQVLEPVE